MRIKIETPYYETFLLLLNYGLKQTGLRNNELATAADISPSFIGGLLQGRINLSPYQCLNILQALSLYQGRIPTDVNKDVVHTVIEQISKRLVSEGVNLASYTRDKSKTQTWGYLEPAQLEIFVNLLMEELDKQGVTTSQFCKMTDVSNPYVYDLLKMKRSVSEITLNKLIDTLGMDRLFVYNAIGKVPADLQKLMSLEDLKVLDSQGKKD